MHKNITFRLACKRLCIEIFEIINIVNADVGKRSFSNEALALRITSVQAVQTSVKVINLWPPQDATHPEYHNLFTDFMRVEDLEQR